MSTADAPLPAAPAVPGPPPHMLLVPSAFLSLSVLGFILLGEAVRDALDPKLR